MTPRMRTVTSGFFCMLSQLVHLRAGKVCGCTQPGRRLGLRITIKRCVARLAQRPLVVVVEVESTHLVGTVVRAIARADAAIVGHDVQSLLVVHGGVDGTDLFTRSDLAMLAHHRLTD